MSKDRRNISLDPEVNDAIDPGVTYSDLVNDWTRQYFIEGNYYSVEKAMFEELLEQVESSREEMHETVDEMHDELAAELQATIEHIDTTGHDEGRETGSDKKWDEAMDVLSDVERSRGNPAIQNWANKLNTSPDELIERLNEEHGDRGVSADELRSVS